MLTDYQHFEVSKPSLIRAIYDVKEIIFIYCLLALATLFISSYLNYIVAGHVLLGNDELKFFYHAKGVFSGTEEAALRSEKDFLGYAWLTKWLVSIGLGFSFFGLKFLSFIFSILYIPLIYIAYYGVSGFKKIHILYAVMFPLVLYYSTSGVRDSLVTFFYLAFIAFVVQDKLTVPVLIRFIFILFFSYLIRPESVLILSLTYIIYKIIMNWRRRFAKVAVVILVIILSVGLYQNYYYFDFYINNIPGTKASTDGFLAFARGLYHPFDFIVMGLLNVLGSFPPWNYLSFEAARDFDSLGEEFTDGTAWVPANFLQAMGVLALNFMFPINIFIICSLLYKLIFNSQMSREGGLFFISISMLFFLGRFSIEHGKMSEFYPCIVVSLCILLRSVKERVWFVVICPLFVSFLSVIFCFL